MNELFFYTIHLFYWGRKFIGYLLFEGKGDIPNANDKMFDLWK